MLEDLLRDDGACFGVRRKLLAARLVGDDFHRADETDSARLTDERVIGKRLQPGLETRRDLTDMTDDVALLVNFQGLQSNGRRYRMAAVSVTGAVGPVLAALLDEGLVNGIGDHHGGNR